MQTLVFRQVVAHGGGLFHRLVCLRRLGAGGGLGLEWLLEARAVEGGGGGGPRTGAIMYGI